MSITQKTRGGNLMQASILCLTTAMEIYDKSTVSQFFRNFSLDDTASQKQQIAEGLEQSKWIYRKEIKSG